MLHDLFVAEKGLQHGLRLEQGLDFVLQLHRLDIVLHLLVGEEELSDLNLVLFRKALAQLAVSQLVRVWWILRVGMEASQV